MSRIFRLALVCASLVSPAARGRPIEDWSFERLFKEADLVVLAKPEKITRVDAAPRDERMRQGYVGRLATFTVVNALKGDPKGKTVGVLHFKPTDGLMSQNGALLVTFRTEPVRIEGKAGGDGKTPVTRFVMQLPPPHYLLFLKTGPDGRAELVSGQYDARLSVREVLPPMPEFLAQP